MSSPSADPPLVRLATAADAPALARMRYEFRISLDEPAEPEAAFVERCTTWMAEELARPNAWRCWMSNSVPLEGAVWMLTMTKIPNPVGEPERHGYVSNFYVRPAARGRGLGSALLTACLTACDGEGFDALILWPTPRSRMLYQRHGFKTQGELMQRRRAAGAHDDD